MSDLISRSALWKAFDFCGVFIERRDRHIAQGMVEDAPTVDAAPVVHGEWEECDWVEYDGHVACVRYPKGALRCSECYNAFKKDLLWKNNFCPNCGSDMRKKVQE